LGPGSTVQSRLAGSHRLTAAEAAPFATQEFLAGADHWDPIAEAAKLPWQNHIVGLPFVSPAFVDLLPLSNKVSCGWLAYTMRGEVWVADAVIDVLCQQAQSEEEATGPNHFPFLVRNCNGYDLSVIGFSNPDAGS
jgi:hypothetical protein